MKKFILILSIVILSLTLLVACGESNEDESLIRIGVSPVPHGEIIEFIEEDLKAEGITLEIVEFTDYVKPNIALDDNEIDANYFQHEPYLNDFKAEKDLDLIAIGGVHLEPMGLYSTKFESIEDIEDGSEIAIPNDSSNGGRALLLLEKFDLITLKDSSDLLATESDIVENPKNLKFVALDAAQLPRVVEDIGGAVINGNYAIESGLVPTTDSILLEDEDSPYTNIVAVRNGEEKQERFIKLMEVLQSDKVREFIEEKYKGGVAPGF